MRPSPRFQICQPERILSTLFIVFVCPVALQKYSWQIMMTYSIVVGRGPPLQGPKSGILSNTRKRIVRGDTCWQSKRGFIGSRHQGAEQQGTGTRRAAPPRGSQSRVLWWWDWFPGGLWPVILIQSPSWWHTHRSAKKDAREGFWEVDGHAVSPFDLSKLFRLVVAY